MFAAHLAKENSNQYKSDAKNINNRRHTTQNELIKFQLVNIKTMNRLYKQTRDEIEKDGEIGSVANNSRSNNSRQGSMVIESQISDSHDFNGSVNASDVVQLDTPASMMIKGNYGSPYRENGKSQFFEKVGNTTNHKKTSSTAIPIPNLQKVDSETNSLFDIATVRMIQKTEQISINSGTMKSDLSISLKYINRNSISQQRRASRLITSKISIFDSHNNNLNNNNNNSSKNEKSYSIFEVSGIKQISNNCKCLCFHSYEQTEIKIQFPYLQANNFFIQGSYEQSNLIIKRESQQQNKKVKQRDDYKLIVSVFVLKSNKNQQKNLGRLLFNDKLCFVQDEYMYTKYRIRLSDWYIFTAYGQKASLDVTQQSKQITIMEFSGAKRTSVKTNPQIQVDDVNIMRTKQDLSILSPLTQGGAYEGNQECSFYKDDIQTGKDQIDWVDKLLLLSAICSKSFLK